MEVASSGHFRIRLLKIGMQGWAADRVDVTPMMQTRAMLQKNCKKCCVVAVGSYIELAFSNKVAEDWHARLRRRRCGRHIEESYLQEQLQKMLSECYWKLQRVCIFDKSCIRWACEFELQTGQQYIPT